MFYVKCNFHLCKIHDYILLLRSCLKRNKYCSLLQKMFSFLTELKISKKMVPFTTPNTSIPRHIKPNTHQTLDKEYRAANYTTDKNTFLYFK